LVFKLYRDHFGTIPVIVTGNSPQTAPKYPPGGEEPRTNAGSPTFPLDVAAAWTDDRKVLTVAVINPTESEQTLDLSFSGVDLAGTGTVWRMAPERLEGRNVVGQEPEVVVIEESINAVPAKSTFAPYSVTLYRLSCN
jgi:alpha-N-arabinofuranosidase